MKVISGKFKGKKLILPNAQTTRPLRDFVKENIFNLIMHSKRLNLIFEIRIYVIYLQVRGLLELSVYLVMPNM